MNVLCIYTIYVSYWLREELQVFLEGSLLLHTLYSVGTSLSTLLVITRNKKI